MFTFTTLTWCSSAIRSSTGETAWHGPHHSAQKSTITLPSDFRTSVSKVSVVASVANCFLSQSSYTDVNAGPGTFVPDHLGSKHVRAAPGQTRSQRARAGDPGALG